MEAPDADSLNVPGLGFLLTFVALAILSIWIWQRRRSVYLLDFQVYKPPDRYLPMQWHLVAHCCVVMQM